MAQVLSPSWQGSTTRPRTLALPLAVTPFETASHRLVRLRRVLRRAGATNVRLGAYLPESIHASAALVGGRPVIVASADDHLLVLAVLLYQALIQFHSLVLQFGASILLKLPLSLFVLLLRISIIKRPRQRFITLVLVAPLLLLPAFRNTELLQVFSHALFVSLIALSFILGVLFILLPVLFRLFLCAECVICTSLDLLINIPEHAIYDFLCWRRHRSIISLARLEDHHQFLSL